VGNLPAAITGKPILNWLNADEYKFGNKIQLNRWAWEFLRRNPDYQADFVILRSKFDEARASGVDVGTLVIYEPSRLENETEQAWLARCGCCKCVLLGLWSARKWKLNSHFLPDPFQE
jgi:hypothetical protein